jgi:hypothetical protein
MRQDLGHERAAKAEYRHLAQKGAARTLAYPHRRSDDATAARSFIEPLSCEGFMIRP